MSSLCLCDTFLHSVAQLLQHYLGRRSSSWDLKRVQDLKCKWPRESQGLQRMMEKEAWSAVSAAIYVVCGEESCSHSPALCTLPTATGPFVLGQYLVQLSLKSFKEVWGFLYGFYIRLCMLCVTVGSWTVGEMSFKVYIPESQVNKTVSGTEALTISWPNYSVGSFVP